MKYLQVVPGEFEEQALKVHHLHCSSEVILHDLHKRCDVRLSRSYWLVAE